MPIKFNFWLSGGKQPLSMSLILPPWQVPSCQHDFLGWETGRKYLVCLSSPKPELSWRPKTWLGLWIYSLLA